jgi:hypothetical protein
MEAVSRVVQRLLSSQQTACVAPNRRGNYRAATVIVEVVDTWVAAEDVAVHLQLRIWEEFFEGSSNLAALEIMLLAANLRQSQTSPVPDVRMI